MSKFICFQHARDEWLTNRSKYKVTSTSIRDALGYAYTGEDSPDSQLLMDIGSAAEPLIIGNWLRRAELQGYELHSGGALYEHQTNPLWATTTDGLVRYRGMFGVIEAKHRTFSAGRYRYPGIEDMAERIQCLWHLVVVDEAQFCTRIAFVNAKLVEDLIMRDNVADELAELERVARCIESDDPLGVLMSPMAEPAVVAKIVANLPVTAIPDKPEVVDESIERYLAAGVKLALADKEKDRALAQLVAVTGNQPKIETDKYYYDRPMANPRRAPKIREKRSALNEW